MSTRCLFGLSVNNWSVFFSLSSRLVTSVRNLTPPSLKSFKLEGRERWVTDALLDQSRQGSSARQTTRNGEGPVCPAPHVSRHYPVKNPRPKISQRKYRRTMKRDFGNIIICLLQTKPLSTSQIVLFTLLLGNLNNLRFNDDLRTSLILIIFLFVHVSLIKYKELISTRCPPDVLTCFFRSWMQHIQKHPVTVSKPYME